MKPRLVYVGLFLLTAAVLCIELLQMRLLSFMLWHHLAYMVISMALLGLGAGGALLAARAEKILLRWESWIAASVAAAGVATVAAFALTSRVGLDTFDLSGWDYVALALYYAVLAVPFLFAGLALAIVFTVWVDRIGRVYFVDLAGSALGCYLFYFLIEPLGAPRALVLMAALLAVAGVLFSLGSGSQTLRRVTVGIAVLLAAAVPLADDLVPASPAGTKALAEMMTLDGARIVGTRWTPIARIDVLEADESAHLFLPDWPGDSMKVVTVDGDAQTYIFRRPDVREGVSRPELFELTNYELAMLLKSGPDVLIIGPGGGHEIYVAHQMGASSVTGVELNPAILEMSRDTYAEFAGNIYQSMLAEPVVGEGRNFLRRSDRKFDVIQMTGVVTWAGLSSGSYVLSESYVYTVEAFRDLFLHLKPDGILAVSRFRLTPARETLRVVSIAYRALEDLGVDEPAGHIAVMSLNPTLAMVLAKLSPFTTDEIALLKDAAAEADGVIFAAPGVATNTPYAELLQAFAADREVDFFDAYPYNVTPVYDDRPFFFEYYKWSRFLDDFGGVDESVRGANRPVAITVLGSMLGLGGLLSAVLVIGPLAVFRRMGLGVTRWWSAAGYFVLIGVAFMFVEISMMQRFVLFLGHPGYSVPVVLASLLIFAGIGSYVTSRLPLAESAKLVVGLLGAPVALGVLLVVQFPLFDELLGRSLGARAVVTMGMMAIPGVLMGMPFPLGLTVVARVSRHLVPWAWGINGAASVIGAVFVVFVAMSLGFTWTVVIAAALYVGALAALWPMLALTHDSDVA
jgi:hypothetical protein